MGKCISKPRNGFRVIAVLLKNKIIQGHYPEGTTLPSVRTMAESYQVSPQTISNAIALLEKDGFVEIKRGSGTRVCYRTVTGPQFEIGMLVDSKRSQILNNVDIPEFYHSKDIYLTYILRMNQNAKTAGFVIFQKDQKELSSQDIEQLECYKAFIVQGSLPSCYVKWLSEHAIPTVLINREIPKGTKGFFGEVLIDDSKMLDAMNYLCSLGHKQILFVVPSYLGDPYVINRRYESCCDIAAKTLGRQAFQLEILHLQDDLEANIKTLKERVDKGFTASIGFNDVSALYLYQLLQEMKISIPSQFSVIGFDDIFAASLSSPPLTTFKVAREQLVNTAFTLLYKLQEAKNKHEETLLLSQKISCQFIIRKSTGVSSLLLKDAIT